ncbi:MAG: aminotransferase class I/II-fold pyridoxal phosphate-dependent enzyme [Gemmatimonadetes bacterium]|nr:aminotransferase class I/II-fold pyridoxal phosphate-dependent enzyme [Gemmatimonadota bacterium]
MTHEPFHLERYFAATEFSTPHLLAVSDCETRTVGSLLDLEVDADARFRALRLGYTESEGGLELRTAVARTYEGLTADDILVHATPVEAVYTTMRALVEPGDRVVVQMPAYQALRSAAAFAGAEVVPWWGDPELGWTPDLEALDALLSPPRTRLLVVNTPHNPTGWAADEAVLVDILSRARRAGVRVFCDEAYRGTEPGGRSAPSAVERSETAVALGLVSKGMGLPGLRTGWLVSRDASVLRRIGAYKDFTSICGPAPSEFLAAVALRHRDRLLSETRALLERNLAQLGSFMARHVTHFAWMAPAAGPVTFPRLRDPERWGGVDAFCRRVRDEAGVLLAPGGLFGGLPATPDVDRAVADSFRIGFGRSSFPEALGVFEDWLTAHS